MSEAVHEDVLSGGGESGALMRSVDWASTAVGPVDSWPQSLRTALGILLDNSFGMAIGWGPDYTFFYNDAYRPILGSTKQPAAMGRPIRQVFPEIWHIIGPMFDDVMRGRTFGWDDWRLPLDRNGFTEECFFTFSYSPIRAESGGVGGVLVTVAEITSRVLGERRMRILRDIAARTAEAPTDDAVCRIAAEVLAKETCDLPFVRIDLAGERPWPSEETLEDISHLGITHRDDFGEALVRKQLVLPIAPGAIVAGLSPRLKFDEHYKHFLRLLASSIATAVANVRAYREAEQRADALAELDRAKTVFFDNLRESEARYRQLAEELEIANRAKDEFLTTLSHELRTPMTATLGWATMLRLNQADDAGRRQAIEAIEQSTRAQAKLIDDILDVSRISTGKLRLALEPVSLEQIIETAVASFRQVAESKDLTITSRIGKLRGSVIGDVDRLGQIVRNLLSNAVKFTPRGGTIDVELDQTESGHARIRVRDSGSGIPPDFLPFVFDRFRQAQSGLTRMHGGLGIGLSIVKDLIELHGGSVAAASKGPGKGATFTVMLPLVERATESPFEMLNVDMVKLDGIPVLVVEDDEATRTMLRTALTRFGAKVSTASSVDEALSMLATDTRSIVVSDIAMPGADGYALIARLRAAERRNRTIALTANARKEDRDRVLAAGFDAFLAKPVDLNTLAGELRRLVDS